MKKLEPKAYSGHVLVCEGKHCGRDGGRDLARALRRDLRQRGVRCRVSRTACLGQCKRSCVVAYEGPKGRWWGEATPDDAGRLGKKIAKRLRKAS